MNDILSKRTDHAPPQTQEEGCLLAVRQSIATLGPVTSDADIRDAARGLAQGLFGEAYVASGRHQRVIWINMCERAYRKALNQIL